MSNNGLVFLYFLQQGEWQFDDQKAIQALGFNIDPPKVSFFQSVRKDHNHCSHSLTRMPNTRVSKVVISCS